MSQATERLRDAPESPCPHCGRVTKTTSDGICAACWRSKGGRPMGWKKAPPGGSLLDELEDLLDLRFGLWL